MDIIIERLDGTQYKFSDYNISIDAFKIDSPSPRFNWETIDGRHGSIDMGTTYDQRGLHGSFEYMAEDFLDFPLLRNEIFKLLDSREAFYLIDDREPGKRWLVKANGYSPEQLIANRGKFDVDFISPSAFAESVGTTKDPFTFDSEKWQIGMGLPADTDLTYTFTTSTFSVFNAGDIAVDPRELPLVITFNGTSTNLSIKNNTTGDEWTYTGTTASQIIKLDGVKATKSNVSIFKDTNKKLITLKPGWNDFVITGASGSFTISFDFRFYYL